MISYVAKFSQAWRHRRPWDRPNDNYYISNGRRFPKSTFRVSLLSTFRVSRINYSLVCSLPIHTLVGFCLRHCLSAGLSLVVAEHFVNSHEFSRWHLQPTVVFFFWFYICCTIHLLSCLVIEQGWTATDWTAHLITDSGRIPLGYPATNYQPAPNETRSGGSWVTRQRPKSAGIESSGG